MKYIFVKEMEENERDLCKNSIENASFKVHLFLNSREEHRFQNRVISNNEIFLVDADAIIGIAYDEGLTGKVGSVHPRLTEEGTRLYEYACRLVSVAEECSVSFESSIYEKKEQNNQYAFVYAYVIRLHVNELYSRGQMDGVFKSVCSFMQFKGYFLDFQTHMNDLMTDNSKYENWAGYTAPYVILRGDDTCGGVLQQFADDLSESLISNGQAVIKIGGENSDYDKLSQMVLKGIVGFQSHALEIDFFKNLHGPRFQFWFDYPLHFDDILRDYNDNEYVLCQDANYADLIRKYYKGSNALHFSPGGIYTDYYDGERPYDIAFLGSFFPDGCESLTVEQRQFYEFLLENPNLTYEEALWEINHWSEEETISNDEIKDRFLELSLEMKPACRAVIGHFRNSVIESILNSGFDLHVYGNSWKTSPYMEYPNLILHPQISPKDTVKELQKAKIGLNVMSWHKAGMTERIANILLSGAVCLTDETSYLKDNLKDRDELLFYRIDELERLPDIINSVLKDAESIKLISKRGYEKAAKEYTWDARSLALNTIAEKDLDGYRSIRIFVATHVEFHPPQIPIYMPLHVGKKGKTDLGYIGDDTGENISDLNYLYGELTGLYWIWKNIEDIDYVGLCHYRRYFIDAKKQIMKKEEYLQLLSECDAIVAKVMSTEEGRSYYEHFGSAHNKHDLEAVERALNKVYPDYSDAFQQAMNGTKYYWGNLVVTSLKILKAYSEWLFTIFAEASEEIDVSNYDDYHKRVYGFLSEQMFYVYALKNRLILKEVAVGISDEKAETKELKIKLKQLINEGQYQKARELLLARLDQRKDMLLPNSDINNELRDIYIMLFKDNI